MFLRPAACSKQTTARCPEPNSNQQCRGSCLPASRTQYVSGLVRTVPGYWDRGGDTRCLMLVRFVPLHTGWCSLVCGEVLKAQQASTSTATCVKPDICLHLSTYADISRHLSTYAGIPDIFRHLLTDVNTYLSTYIDTLPT